MPWDSLHPLTTVKDVLLLFLIALLLLAAAVPTNAAGTDDYLLNPLTGLRYTVENMALMCYSEGVTGRLMQPKTAQRQADLALMASRADPRTVSVFGLVYTNQAWHWVGSPQYYPDGMTLLSSSGASSRWAAGYPRAEVEDGAVAGFSAAHGGWVHIDPITEVNWVAVCEPLPTSEAHDDMKGIYLAPMHHGKTVRGAGALMQSCSTNMNPVLTLPDIVTERALKRYLLLTGMTGRVIVGGYFTDPVLENGDWVWLNSWDDTRPTVFAHHYSLSAFPPSSTPVPGAYRNWVSAFPAKQGGRFLAYDLVQGGWVNVDAADEQAEMVACQNYDMSVQDAKRRVFLVDSGEDSSAPPTNLDLDHLAELCDAHNGTAYEANSVLKQRALNLAIQQKHGSDTAAASHYYLLGGEFNSTTSQMSGSWNWLASGTFMNTFTVPHADRFTNWGACALLPHNVAGPQLLANHDGAWVAVSQASGAVSVACAPTPRAYGRAATASEAAEDVVFIVSGQYKAAPPQQYAGNLFSICPSVGSSLFEPDTAEKQAALQAAIQLASTGSANVYIGARYYGDADTGGVWAFDSSGGNASGVFTTNFGGANAMPSGGFSAWVSGYPSGTVVTADGTPGPRFVAMRGDMGGWVNPATEADITYAACYGNVPPANNFNITLVPRSTTSSGPMALCGEGYAPLVVLNASVQAALEVLLRRHGVDASSTVLLGGVFNKDSSAWAWVRDARYPSNAVSFFGTVNTTAYTNWAAGFPQSAATNRYLGFSSAIGGWVNVADVVDAAVVACEPTASGTIDLSKEPCTKVSTCAAGFATDPFNVGNCIAVACSVPNCDACRADYQTRCSVCSAGYDLDKFTGTCVKPACQVPGCKSCQVGNNFLCEECAAGFYLSAESHRCEAQLCSVANCVTCVTGQSGTCAKCSVGYTVNNATGQCLEPPCPVLNCDMCILGDTTRCYRCSSGYALDTKQTCDMCQSGYKKSSSGSCVSSKLPTPTLAGIIVGAVVGVALIVVSLYFTCSVCCRTATPPTYVMTITPEPSLVFGAIDSPTGSTGTSPAPVIMEEGSPLSTTKRRSSTQKGAQASPQARESRDTSVFPSLDLDLDALIAFQRQLRGYGTPEPSRVPVVKRRISNEDPSATRLGRGAAPSSSTFRPVVPPHPVEAGDTDVTETSDGPSTQPAGAQSSSSPTDTPHVFDIDDEPADEPVPLVKVVKRRQHRRNP